MLIRYQEEPLHLQRAAAARQAMLCKHLPHLCPGSPSAKVFHYVAASMSSPSTTSVCHLLLIIEQIQHM